MGSWMPITPEKPIPTRPNPVLLDRYGRPVPRENWQELPGFPVGHMQEMPNYNRVVHNSNPIGQAGHNEGFYGGNDFSLLDRSRKINQIAAALASGNKSNGISTSLANRSNGRSTSFANRALIPNLNAQVENWTESNSSNLLIHNQAHSSSSNLSSNSSIFQLISPDGFPITYQSNYKQNSAPRTESDAALCVNSTLAFSTVTQELLKLQKKQLSTRDFSRTESDLASRVTTTLPPVTPDKFKKLQETRLSTCETFSVDVSSSQENDKQENLLAIIRNETIQGHYDETVQNVAASAVISISTPPEGKKDSDYANDRGIDLTKTPQQKTPKRRKHRPKVIVEGKPKKTPKTATAKSTKTNENPGAKRKYVRRKGLKESATQQADILRDTTDASTGAVASSCRRALNFDMEKNGDENQVEGISQQEEIKQSYRRTFNLNLDSQAKVLDSRTNSRYGTQSTTMIGQQNGLPVEKQQNGSVNNHIHHQPGTVSDQTLSMNQILADYVSLPERQGCAASLPPRKDMDMENSNVVASNVDTRIADPCQKGSRNGYTPTQHHICAEGIGHTVFQAKTIIENLERTRQPMPPSTPQSAPKTSSSFQESRGTKRDYSHAIKQINPSVFNSVGSSLSYQDIFQMDGCHRYSNSVGAVHATAHKRKKIENGLYTIKNGKPFSVHVIKDCPIQVQTKCANDINGSGSPLQRNNGIVGSHSRSYNIAKAGNSAVNKLNSDWPAQSMASGYNLPKEHIFSEQHLHTGTVRETNRWTSVLDFSSSTASEKHNLLPLTPRGRAPAPGDMLSCKTCQTNVSAKQNGRQTLAKSASCRMDQMLPEQRKDLYDPQLYSAERRGSPVDQIYPIPMDEITCRFNSLNLNGSTNHVQEQEQNSIVPYGQDGTIVPYEGFEFIKKRKPRPKVDLDPETNRIWNLLMGKEGIEGLEEMDKEKEKWWEEERRVFQGRADSFIARMHLVQGDRRFSKWKGSVVDSVIGVFLTQNVSDHLSSSAFMSLAARFPLMSNNSTCNMDGINILVEEPEACVLNSDDAIQWNEQVLRHPLSSESSMTPHEPTEHQRENEITGTERTRLLEAHSHSLEEEGISSQDSFSSSILQGHAEIKSYSGSNSETEDPTSGCQANQDHGSTNFLQEEDATLFQDIYNCLKDRSLFQERYGHAHEQSNDTENSLQESRPDSIEHYGSSLTFTQLLNIKSPQNQLPQVPSSDHQLHITYSELLEGSEIYSGECISSQPSTACGFLTAKDTGYTSQSNRQLAEDVSETTVQQMGIPMPEEMSTMSPDASLRKDSRQQQTVCQPGSHSKYNPPYCESMSHTKPANLAVTPAKVQHVPNCTELTDKTCNDEERISVVNKLTENKVIEPNSREQVIYSHQAYGEVNPRISKSKKGKANSEKKNAIEWDGLRKQVQSTGRKKERSKDTMDSLDYEAMRCANVKEISEAIKERGMNNMLAERIKEFLNRLVQEHGSIDLEWLRDVPPDKAKDYLLSIRGLGLKSVECVRLLTLHHLAFPVDTNVGRIAVRLGWVPLQPLPESLQLHLLELYPILESIQKYLWPRLCKLDQRTLYELHYQLITFGKVFCTKSKPNCNACPMRGECRHFASAFASARLALPGPEERNIVTSAPPTTAERKPAGVINPVPLLPPEERSLRVAANGTGNCEPIIEEPATPEQECTEISESDIEDKFYEDPDEIPTIKLNIEEFTVNLQNYMQENMELQEGDMSKAVVALNPEVASIPAPKLKNVSRLRTEHQVYQLPDSHPLLKGMDRREPDDPSPYLLAIWTPGETANSIQPSEKSCGSQESNKLCNEKTCFSCNSVREANSQTVRGTLLIPCRTAMRGSFPLNGTYFQVNEVFADHDSSLNPIAVPREWIWNLPRRIVYFGTSVSTIFKGLSTEGIQFCFWKGFVCVRGFDQKSRAPRPLMARLHFPASKLAKTKK